MQTKLLQTSSLFTLCIVGAVVAAVLGCGQVVSRPLSTANFAYAVQWGLFCGCFGALLAAVCNSVCRIRFQIPASVASIITALASGLTLFVYAATLAAC